MKLIAGLGNPGPKYQWTRHNAGFMVLDALSRAIGIPIARSAFSGLCGEGRWLDNRLVLLKPQTFMNLSGRSVAAALRYHKLDTAQLLVVHDDMDIPFGQIRIKEGGGHGGHNGLRSLQTELGRGDFTRVRVGVGRPLRGDPADYVLANFPADELQRLPDLLEGSIRLLEVLLIDGSAKAMTQYNNKPLLPEP